MIFGTFFTLFNEINEILKKNRKIVRMESLS